jgi:hypothetical protein
LLCVVRGGSLFGARRSLRLFHKLPAMRPAAGVFRLPPAAEAKSVLPRASQQSPSAYRRGAASGCFISFPLPRQSTRSPLTARRLETSPSPTARRRRVVQKRPATRLTAVSVRLKARRSLRLFHKLPAQRDKAGAVRLPHATLKHHRLRRLHKRPAQRDKAGAVRLPHATLKHQCFTPKHQCLRSKRMSFWSKRTFFWSKMNSLRSKMNSF